MNQERTPHGTVPRRAARILLLVYLAGAIVLFLWPDGAPIHRLNLDLWIALRRVGLPREFTPDVLEQIFNVLVFAVPVILARIAFPAVRSLTLLLCALAASFSIEVVQGEILSSRNMDWWDFFFNSVGAVIGLAIAWILPQQREGKDSSHPRS